MTRLSSVQYIYRANLSSYAKKHYQDVSLIHYMNVTRNIIRTRCENDQYIWIDLHQYYVLTNITLVFPLIPGFMFNEDDIGVADLDNRENYHTCGNQHDVSKYNATNYRVYFNVTYLLMSSMRQSMAPDPTSKFWYLITRATPRNGLVDSWGSEFLGPLNIRAISFALFNQGSYGILLTSVIIIGNRE